MKKIILLLFLLLTPTFVSASIDQNLYFGMFRNNSVYQLQQYLINKGFLSGNATGNFYNLTLAAVKKFQASKNIITTGFVGPLTRQAINSDNSVGSNTSTTGKSVVAVAPLTGTIDLSQSPSYLSQSVIAPQTNLKLGDFSFKNNTSELINIKKIEADLAIGSDLYTANNYISNLYITYASNKTPILSAATHNNYWAINYQLPVGQTINVSLYGDVNSLIPASASINSSLLVSGVSAVSGTDVYTNSNTVLAGQVITFGAGTLTVSQDSSTPVSNIVAVNQRVVAGKFQFSTTYDLYNISELKLIIPNSVAIQNIVDAVLLDSSTQTTLTPKPVVAIYNGENYIFDFDINYQIPANSSKSVTIYYDLTPSAGFNSANRNTNLAPILAYVKAKKSDGTIIDGVAANYKNYIPISNNIITIPDTGITFNNLYILKSIPTFTAATNSASASNNIRTDIYTFNIAANSAGDVSVKQIMFNIAISDPNNNYPYLNRFTLFKGSTDYTGSVAIADITYNNYVGLSSNNGVSVGTSTVVLTFNNEETISAGKNQTYILKAFTNNFIGSSVSVSILQDAAISSNGSYLRRAFTNVYGLASTAQNINVVNYNLLWSDKSASAFFPHSDSNGNSTDDWYNGFGVQTFPSSTQTISSSK